MSAVVDLQVKRDERDLAARKVRAEQRRVEAIVNFVRSFDLGKTRWDSPIDIQDLLGLLPHLEEEDAVERLRDMRADCDVWERYYDSDKDRERREADAADGRVRENALNAVRADEKAAGR